METLLKNSSILHSMEWSMVVLEVLTYISRHRWMRNWNLSISTKTLLSNLSILYNIEDTTLIYCQSSQFLIRMMHGNTRNFLVHIQCTPVKEIEINLPILTKTLLRNLCIPYSIDTTLVYCQSRLFSNTFLQP